jgi:hypothetical protein
MVDESSVPKLPIPVTEGPHWRVIIKPQVFRRDRIASLKDCWHTVERCRVPWSGWDYPYIHKENRAEGPDWIASWCESSWRDEYWKFFQSGQFIHLFSFKEDKEAECERLARFQIRFPNGFTPAGFIDVGTTVRRLTEITEFAARLSQKALFAEGSSISIQMNRVRDRVLFDWNRKRTFFPFSAAREDNISWEQAVPITDLVARTSGLAIDVAVWVFERFNYSNVPRRALEEEQRKFLEEKF